MGFKRILASIFAFCSLVLAVSAEAQIVTGTIVGTLRDESGAVLPGATVNITSPALIGGPKTDTTNDSGFFRFPALSPGIYTLNITLSGFSTHAEEGLRVVVGGTVEKNVTLKLAAVAETITVTGESPVVDTQATDISTNYTREWVQNAPVRRFTFFDLINAAPGVAPAFSTTSRSIAFGSGADDNSYQLDGTDFTAPLTGAAWPWPNTDVIEEIEVLSLGAAAEYGNLQGAVFNVVTRQGGNAFDGDLNFYFQHQKLTDRNTTDEVDNGLPYDRDRFNDFTANVGGPVVKDRFWFFGSYQYQRDYESQPGTPPEFPARSDADRIFFKLTYQHNPKNKFMFALHDDFYRIPGRATAVTAPSTIGVEHGHNPSPNLTWTSILSDKTYIEARYSGFYGVDHGDPLEPNEPRVKPRFYDLGTGFITGGIYAWYDGKSFKTAFAGKVSHFADNFLGGSHDFKFGVQYNSGGGEYTVGYNDYIYTYYGDPQYGYTQVPTQTFGHVNSIGVFADDAFRVSDRLTLNLGVRADHQVASFPETPVLDRSGNETGQVNPGVEDLFSWNSVSPRLGAILKLTADGRTVLKAHYGRYYKGIVTGEFEGAGPGVTPRFLFSGTYDAAGNPIGLELVSDNSQLRIDPDYKNPYTDQFIVGFERELMRDLSFQVNYVHKRMEHLGGWQEIAGEYVPVIYRDTAGTDASGRDITVYRLLTSPDERVFLLTNPDPSIRGESLSSRYNGVLLGVTKRMSNRWSMVASLVLSKSEGRIPSSSPGSSTLTAQNSQAGNGFGRNPNDYVNTEGRLIADRPVIGKVQFVYEWPGGVTTALNFTHLTGRPWARQVRVPGLGIPTTILAEERTGDRRVADWNILDLRAQKAFNLGRGVDAAFFADVLNLTNSDAHESLLSRLGTSASFGLPARFIYPRRLMVGAKFRF